ncbi:hypothetical protein DERF_001848 [Dermatophagoides farinae]|uniref:Uncharacterized protein n=1 Tax=Dermatophagoides farinae TaxID=6954 RepID=A0A922ICK8_DERFA|nr:hypothetical protein DERF_001848 [Dermatophagoides farinae]
MHQNDQVTNHSYLAVTKKVSISAYHCRAMSKHTFKTVATTTVKHNQPANQPTIQPTNQPTNQSDKTRLRQSVIKPIFDFYKKTKSNSTIVLIENSNHSQLFAVEIIFEFERISLSISRWINDIGWWSALM